MFQTVHQLIKTTEVIKFIESEKHNYVFKDYDAGDFDSLIELWCFIDSTDYFDYSSELEMLQEIYKFKQNPIFIDGIPNDIMIKKMLENIYRSITHCPLLNKTKHEKFLYDFCVLNCESLPKQKLQDIDFIKIAFALLFGENKLYYNLTYLSLISVINHDEFISKKITDAMRFIHYCVFCLEENESEKEEETTEIISFMVDENNGSVSFQEIVFK